MRPFIFPKLAFLYLGLASLIAAFIFYRWPMIDLKITRFFYDPTQGFAYNHAEHIQAMYFFVSHTSNVFAGFLVVMLAIKLLARHTAWIWGNRFFRRFRLQVVLYLLVTLIVGPWLGIHHGIKEFFDRPRPREVIEFGGELPYLQPLAIGNVDSSSFVSGHASMGFYLAAIALLLTGWQRVALYVLALVAGGVIGMGRIMQGAHFASDIVYSGIFTLMVVHLCYAFFVRKKRQDDHG